MTRKRASRTGRIFLAAAVLMAGAFWNGSANAAFKIVHSFAGADGYSPVGSLILSGNTLYGMTNGGGENTAGTVFRVNTDGKGFSILHSFSGAETDGSYPYGSLTLSGSILYGMTSEGGANGMGTVFRVDANGNGFQLLHSFSGSATDGSYPNGSLVLSGSTLYGMTGEGGVNGMGTVFRIETDGTGFQLLHSFSGSATDGSYPDGSLVLSGSTLYGMTTGGGAADMGTVFRITTAGAAFLTLHSFEGGAADGAYPSDSLILSGSTLYGMTKTGGAGDWGVIFRLATEDNSVKLLHSFNGPPNDGAYPNGSLTLSGSTLYGMTMTGGGTDEGALFRISSDGAGFGLLRSFPSGQNDGIFPSGSLTVSGNRLYGLTSFGTLETCEGVIFSLDTVDTLTPVINMLLLQQ